MLQKVRVSGFGRISFYPGIRTYPDQTSFAASPGLVERIALVDSKSEVVSDLVA
jgi:hypothetical protein